MTWRESLVEKFECKYCQYYSNDVIFSKGALSLSGCIRPKKATSPLFQYRLTQMVKSANNLPSNSLEFRKMLLFFSLSFDVIFSFGISFNRSFVSPCVTISRLGRYANLSRHGSVGSPNKSSRSDLITAMKSTHKCF